MASDDDSDGIANDDEMGPLGNDPNYDGDNDGTPDNEQSNVVSFPSSDGANYLTFSIGTGGVSFVNFEVIDVSSLDNTPPNFDFPFGLFNFELNGVGPGTVHDINIFTNGGPVPATYYKYGPTSGNLIPHWYQYPYNPSPTIGYQVNPGIDINGKTVDAILWFTNGSDGDDDLNSNNDAIIDLGGPATPIAQGSNNGCFIATAVYGSYWQPHVMILRQFRDEYLLTNKIGAKFVDAYYKYSPPVAGYIAEHDGLRSAVRIGLAPLVGFSWLAMNFGMMVALAVLFGVLTMIIGGTCLVVRKTETS
jgi:hypothetical protein